ncbi:MAG: 7-cyano-7-deazaguanine synthase QueC [Gammaproteobacteria bacterium]|tara:strand:- start:7928 stop:8602 length:675 start_codon:yes stop_codon:yes gene_type:complete
MTKKKAVVILSGGMDSVTTLAIAKDKNFDCYNLTFDYGQKSISEIRSATYYSDKFESIEHKIFNINFNDFTNSSLIDKNTDIPVNKNDVIPTTYVPMRNIIFLSIACSWAEKVGASDIFIGANAIDYSGYPDCRDIFLEAYEKMINLGSKTGSEGGQFNIHRPLINLKKTEIISTGKSLGLDYRKTISCYQATSDGKACGVCESCLFRKNAFLELGLEDETIYV